MLYSSAEAAWACIMKALGIIYIVKPLGTSMAPACIKFFLVSS